MEVIQRLVRLFHRAEGPLHFAFRAGRGAAAIVATGQMRLHLDAQIGHHLLKHVTARHWTVIRIQVGRTATKGKALVRLGGHGVEQKLQSHFRRLPIGAVILLVGHTTAIIDHAKQHEGGRPFARVDPGRRLDLFEIRGADIKLPQLIAVLGLETHRRWFPP